MKKFIVAMLSGVLIQFCAIDVQAATENTGKGIWYVPATHKSKGLYDQLFQLSNEFDRALHDINLKRMCGSLKQMRKLLGDSGIALTEGQIGYMNCVLLNISIRYLLYAMQFQGMSKTQLTALQQNNFETVLNILSEYGVQSIHIECAFAILNKLFSLYTDGRNPALINDAIIKESNGFVLLNMNTIRGGGTPQQEQVSRRLFGEYQWLPTKYIALIVSQQSTAHAPQVPPYVAQPMSPYSAIPHQYGAGYYWPSVAPVSPMADQMQLSQGAPTPIAYVQAQPSKEVEAYFKTTGMYSVLEILAQSVFGLPSGQDGVSTKNFSVDSLRNTYRRLSNEYPQLLGYASDMQKELETLLQKKLDNSRERGMPKDDGLYQQKCKELFSQIIGK